MKKLIVPVFGLLLAACTFQFAPTGQDDARRPDFNTPGPSAATAGVSLPSVPATDGGFSPGAPGGSGGPSSPDPASDGSGGAMPDMPAGGTMPGG